MKLSVVIRTHNEAPRLRIALASLAAQLDGAEIIVVDDGSTDATRDVLVEAKRTLPLTTVSHPSARGRTAASNAGAEAARGDVLLFLDGDTLAAPGTVAAHIEAHRADPLLLGRGETWHLRCTRFLADPEALIAWPGEADRIAALPPAEREKMRVTVEQALTEFGAIAGRAAPGVYPGFGPARLHALEMAALAGEAPKTVLWAAASGSNFSVPRTLFQAVGGFHPALDINEHRELALRLEKAGGHMGPVPGARTYHLTHRSGWRDPLAETGWEAIFRAAHPDAPLDRLKAFWAGLSGAPPATDRPKVETLADLIDA